MYDCHYQCYHDSKLFPKHKCVSSAHHSAWGLMRSEACMSRRQKWRSQLSHSSAVQPIELGEVGGFISTHEQKIEAGSFQ